MPALTFKPQFADKVEAGMKRQTIRPRRKVPIRTGQTLLLRAWTGAPYLTKQRVLGQAICRSVDGIVIHDEGIELSPGTLRVFFMRQGGSRQRGLDKFAGADGFADWTEMRAWFEKTHGLPFEGVLIKW